MNDVLAALDLAGASLAGDVVARDRTRPLRAGRFEPLWPDPIPLRPDLPAPDISALPPALRDHIRSVADHLQVPIELPLSYGLGAVASAALGTFTVEVAWREPLCLWTCAVLPPSVRKTGAERLMFAPVRKWETRQAEDTKDERRRWDARRTVLGKSVRHLEDRAAKADPTERAELLHQLDTVQRELDETPPGHAPRRIADDVTPERLVGLMAENNGRIAIASAEPGVFAMMAGKYQDHEQAEVYRKAWSGDEPIVVDRQGRDGQRVENPALVLAVAAQPAAFETLQRKHELRGLGTLARFVYWMPRACVGYRLTGDAIPPLDAGVAHNYASMLDRILSVRGEHVLTLDPEARSTFDDWHAAVERDLRPGGPLSDLADWGGKLHGQTLRIAGVLHLARHPGAAGEHTIGAETMHSAIEIARVARGHAAGALGLLDRGGDRIALAEYVLAKIDAPLTVRELFQRVKGKASIQRTDDLRRALKTLSEHSLVHVTKLSATGPGRPSEIVVPNPRSVTGNRFPKSSETPGTIISEDFENGFLGNQYETAERFGMEF